MALTNQENANSSTSERKWFPLNIFVDADASPVQKETISIAKKFDILVYVIKSYAHFSLHEVPNHVEIIYVDSERDAADMAIAERANKNDIVITQDYGLASICLGKGCIVMHHKGFLYTDENIDKLLAVRHSSAKLRRAGKRTKGPKPFTHEDREKFKTLLETTIVRILNEE